MSRIARTALCLLATLTFSGCRFAFERSLEPGDIRGTLVVVDAQGNRSPAAGAHVTLENAPATVKADSNGRFVLRGLPFGFYDLSISWKPAPGSPGEVSGLRLRGIDLSEKVGGIDLGTVDIGGLGAVHGVVEGDAVGDLLAVVDGVGQAPVLNGTFAFEKLAAGEYEVALVGDAGVWSGGTVKVMPRKATDVEIDTGVAAETIGSITGQARRTDGGSFASVTVFLAGANMVADAIDSSGRWSLSSVAAGMYTLVAQAPGMLTTQRPFVVVAGATVAPDLVLVPVGTGCALGGVGVGTDEDADGDGVPDALEPESCWCHPGFIDANDDGVCDDPVDDENPAPECETNDACGGNTKHCLVDPGKCVQCLETEHCESGEFCNDDNACELLVVGPDCTTNDQCADNDDGTTLCLVDPGVCVECLDAFDCGRFGHCNADNVCEGIVEGPQCQTEAECSDDPYCLLPDGRCVGCLTNENCGDTEFCNGDNTCEEMGVDAPCLMDDACEDFFETPYCFVDGGICVECLEGGDCDSGVCLSNHTCERGEWEIGLDENLKLQGSHVLARLGNTVALHIVNLPPGAQVEVESVGSPAVDIFFDSRSSEYLFDANAIGTVVVEVMVRPAGESIGTVKTRAIQVLHNPDDSVFFDPVDGNDANEGTLVDPKKDPVAYLAAMDANTFKRHLYIREGVVDTTSDVVFNAGAGPEQIIVTGGYGADDDWTRNAAVSRTRFVDAMGSQTRFAITGDTTDVVVDGLVIDNREGVFCNGEASLRLLNSQVIAQYASALTTNDCAGIAVGNILMGGDLWQDAPVMLGRGSGPASSFRLIHNLVTGSQGKPFQRSGLLGGDVRFNTFLETMSDITLDATQEFDGNAFALTSTGPESFRQRLGFLNNALLPQAANIEMHCTGIQNTGNLQELRDTGVLDSYLPEACELTTPLPVFDDVIATYALRYDRHGNFRPDHGRWRGPDQTRTPLWNLDLELTAERVSPQSPIIGTPFEIQVDVSGTTANTRIELEPEGMTELEVDASGAANGVYSITAGMVGSAAVRVHLIDDVTSQSRLSTVVRFDVRPNRPLLFVDFNEQTNGSGSELAPFNIWPGLYDGDDVLVAEATTTAGAKLSSGWLPEGVRVFGGYARDENGLFVRRLSVVDTNLRNENATFPVQIDAGTSTSPSTARVVDGIVFASSNSSQPALIVNGGPLLLLRSRVVNQYQAARSVLEVGAPSENVAVVGSAIAYSSASASKIDLVRLAAGATPTFLFNDIYRAYWMSPTTTLGSAFRAMGNDTGGVYAGNRYWVENALKTGIEYAFFDTLGSPGFAPTLVAANAIADVDTNTYFALRADDGLPKDWPSLESGPTQGTNMNSDACATVWFAGGASWAPAATASCANGARLATTQALGIESALAAPDCVGVEFDYTGFRRPEDNESSIGATQSRAF